MTPPPLIAALFKNSPGDQNGFSFQKNPRVKILGYNRKEKRILETISNVIDDYIILFFFF